MAHGTNMRSMAGLVQKYIGTDYDKIAHVSDHMDEILELLELMRQYLNSPSVDLNMVYVQATPATVWEIQHNFHKYPSVSIIDDDGQIMEGQVDYVDTDNLAITFSEPVSGRATIN